MRVQFLPRLDAQQAVRQAAVAHIDLRGFEFALAEMGVPRGQPARDIGAAQDVEIVSCSGF